MTRPQSNRINELFDEAAELPASARSAFLDRHCSGDPALRREIDELLAHDNAQRVRQSFMTPPADLLPEAWSSPEIGSVVAGRYRLLQVLGEGGMGVVYLAEQVTPRRTVALKVIRPGLVSEQVLRRFSQEAELLGRLQHPGIAQIYDAGNAGTDDRPVPFFVMEHVRGRPLMEHCRHAGLPAVQRLELFARICDAVQYAHAQGIVHRDLKPGNILVVDDESSSTSLQAPGSAPASVSPGDHRGRSLPKILDFGVARSTAADLQSTTLHTAAGQLVGTIPYMSPEQVAGNPALIDARSDVYSLGVILYELLADRLPLEIADRPLPEAIRMISEVDHLPLSAIDRRFRGDLDTIVAKALEKEPERRYQSAADLAQDIRRHLDDQPIVARPASTMYQLRKFARRNKGLVGGIAAAFLLLLLGMVGTTLAMLEARRQRNDARAAQGAAETAGALAKREADLARAVTSFLQDMLITADPLGGDRTIANARDMKVVDALAAASAKIDTSFQDRPDVEAGVRISLGQTYSHLGMYDEAEKHLKRAIELFSRTRGPDDDQTLEVTEMLAFVHVGQHRFSDAEVLQLRILDVIRRRRDVTDPRYLATVNALVVLYTESMRYADAERMLTETLDAWKRSGREHTTDSMELVYNLGWLLQRQGRIEEAEPLVLEAYETRVKLQGEFAPSTLAARNNVAWMHAKFGRYQQAIDMHEYNIALAREHLPPNDWHHGIFKHNYGVALRHVGRYAEAEAEGLEALERLEQSFGVNTERPRRAIESLAELYDAWQKPEQAAAMRARLASASGHDGGGDGGAMSDGGAKSGDASDHTKPQ
jgi:tetratricopeptide (TPR) repeat protein/predicted Ser/Thr protein kinase